MAIGKPLLLINAGMAISIILSLSACTDDTEKSSSHSKYEQSLPKSSITIAAVGDIMLGGTAQEVLMKEGYSYPFNQVTSLLSADITIGNLEGPLTSICNSNMDLDKTYVFRSPAEKVTPALKEAGFNLLNLANNHILDYGLQGMNDTMKSLKAHNIYSVGAGKNSSGARSGIIIDTEHGKYGFLSYSLTFPQWPRETDCFRH